MSNIIGGLEVIQDNSRECTSVYKTIIGTRNLDKGNENEDVVFIDESSDLLFYGLADGQSGKNHCRKGGVETLKTVFQYLRQEGIDCLINREHIDEIQYEVIHLIRKTIEELASKENTDRAEFASTLVVFAYDKQTNNFIVLHLGDGGVIGVRKQNEELTIVGPPDNGITANYTWLTTSPSALSHLRVYFGNINKFSRIVLFTDGAREICHGKNIPMQAQLVCKSRIAKSIIDYMQDSYHEDDASCIVIDFDKTEMI